MGTSDRPEACGRCSMTTVVDATSRDENGEQRAVRDPFGDARIEVDEDQLRLVSAPAVLAGRVKHRLNDVVSQWTYGR
ncbi:hypothetical protein ACFQH6_20100 [Halobacteriaceae archaeon GCM10025711]